MYFKIHRGTKEIGGSCVEIWTNTTHIVVDFGMPMVNPDKTPFDSKKMKGRSVQELVNHGVLPNIPGLYAAAKPQIHLIISHAHQDHYGLLNYVHSSCPIYFGRGTHKLIELTKLFSNQNHTISNPNYFESCKPFNIGDIEITPYLMDHSAFDSYAFLIKADGKRLFYSGDFRIHGRKAKAFYWFGHNVQKNIDYLLLEGTTIGRAGKKFPSEEEIEERFVDAFNQSEGISLIYTSGQNIDRLVSIYRACKRTGKTLAIDFYIATILKDLAEGGSKLPHPSDNFPEIKVFYPYRLSRMVTNQGNEKILYRFKKYKVTKAEIDKQSQTMVMIVRPSMSGDLERLQCLNKGMFIYSMWNGYKNEKVTSDFIGTLLKKGMTEIEIHTSGHADIEGLKRMVNVLTPKNLVPIHTFSGTEYGKIFTHTNIMMLNDNEIVVG